MSKRVHRETDVKLALTKAPTIEWVIAEDDLQWRCAQTATLALPTIRHRWNRYWWLTTTGVLLLLLTVGGWLWHQAHIGLSQIEGELQAAVVADQWRAQRDSRMETIGTGIVQDIAKGEHLAEIADVHLIELRKEWAVVQVTLQQGTFSYRQTRLYRRGVSGWYVSTPSVALWGAPHTLETTYFVFHYYALDTKAVAEAAIKLDALYPDLVASYPLDLASKGKYQVWVSPEYSLLANSNTIPGAVLQIASPAIYLAPIALSEGDILAQAVLLDLLEVLVVQSLEHELPARLDDYQASARVTALLVSLKLWQLWGTPLPLATLHKPTIQWIYRDAQGKHALPGFDAELCPLHQLWRAAPYAIQIPIFCGEPQQVARYEVGRYLPSDPPRSLAEIRLFAPMMPDEPARGLVEAEQVGLAILFDYVGATYGSQSLSALITNAATFSSWDALIPATFGISSTAFETGWQAHLRNNYGISGRDRDSR